MGKLWYHLTWGCKTWKTTSDILRWSSGLNTMSREEWVHMWQHFRLSRLCMTHPFHGNFQIFWLSVHSDFYTWTQSVKKELPRQCKRPIQHLWELWGHCKWERKCLQLIPDLIRIHCSNGCWNNVLQICPVQKWSLYLTSLQASSNWVFFAHGRLTYVGMIHLYLADMEMLKTSSPEIQHMGGTQECSCSILFIRCWLCFGIC